MVHDGLTSTFDHRHMVEQASFVRRELGISREEQDRWAPRSHERAVNGDRRGAASRTRSSRSATRRRRGPSPRHLAREARRAEARLRPGGHDDGGQRARRERRRRRGRRHERGVRAASEGSRCWRRSLAGLRRRRLRVPRADAGQGGRDRAREGGEDDRRRRARRAERGVLLGRANSAKMLGADPER